MGDLHAVFTALRPLYTKHQDACVLLADEARRYALNSHEVRAKDGYVTFFGSVDIKKNFVSAHLFPVYVYPDLLDGISDALRKRMQGKSCFNFSVVEPSLIAELGTLIDAGAARFKADGKL